MNVRVSILVIFINKKAKSLLKTHTFMIFMIILNVQLLTTNPYNFNVQITPFGKSNDINIPQKDLNSNILKDIHLNQNKLYFQKNLGQIQDSFTFFFLNYKNYFIHFQNSSIRLNITTTFQYSPFTILFNLKDSNNIVPKGIEPRAISES